MSLDGWDAWGLLLALLVMATVAIVALKNLTEVELSDDVPWPKITLGLGMGILAVAVVKSLTDADSSWLSYASSRSPCGRRSARTSTGLQREGPTARFSSASAAGSAQSFDEQDAVLARAVVVLDDTLDLESQRFVECDGALVHG